MVKKALLVGINDYAQCGNKRPQLEGCVNDVRDIATTLRDLGIIPSDPSKMHIATNERATRENITAELKWLVNGSKKGDLLVFYYSGYGSQFRDDTSDECEAKVDTICPYDFSTKGMINDDDLHSAFKGVASGVKLEVMLDCCHYGIGTRELSLLSGEDVPEEKKVTIRYIEPPLDLGFFLEDPLLSSRGFLVSSPYLMRKEAVISAQGNFILWTGCKENQTAVEVAIGGIKRGLFTYCFCNSLRRKNSSTTTRRDLYNTVASYLKEVGASQTPLLECPRVDLTGRVFS
jgi:metacaspase-1